MKNTYNTPKLTSFGNVVELTQAIGGPTAADTIFQSPGNPLVTLLGSGDLILIPCDDPAAPNCPV